MIDFESHKDKLEKALAVKNPLTDKNCVDKIDKKLWWDNVIPALNDISIETADELQNETKRYYPKDSTLENKATGNLVGVKTVEELQKILGKLSQDDILFQDRNGMFVGVRRKQKYSEAPPTRLLSMTLDLCYFLGFLDTSGDHEMHEGAVEARERIINAYNLGKASHPNSKLSQSKPSDQSTAKTEKKA